MKHVLYLCLAALVLAIVAFLNVEQANAGLPLVSNAALTQGDLPEGFTQPPTMLWAPCPITNRNFPILPDNKDGDA